MNSPPGKIAVVQVSSGASCNASLPSTRQGLLRAVLHRVIDCLIFSSRSSPQLQPALVRLSQMISQYFTKVQDFCLPVLLEPRWLRSCERGLAQPQP